MIWTTMHVWHNRVPIDLIICNTNFFSLIKWQVKYEEVEKNIHFKLYCQRAASLKLERRRPCFLLRHKSFFSLDICDKRLNFSVIKSLRFFLHRCNWLHQLWYFNITAPWIGLYFFCPSALFRKEFKKKDGILTILDSSNLLLQSHKIFR